MAKKVFALFFWVRYCRISPNFLTRITWFLTRITCFLTQITCFLTQGLVSYIFKGFKGLKLGYSLNPDQFCRIICHSAHKLFSSLAIQPYMKRLGIHNLASRNKTRSPLQGPEEYKKKNTGSSIWVDHFKWPK